MQKFFSALSAVRKESQQVVKMPEIWQNLNFKVVRTFFLILGKNLANFTNFVFWSLALGVHDDFSDLKFPQGLDFALIS